MKNAVQLICYADRLGGTLPGLRELLAGPLAGLFGGVHVLPFFHPIDGADAGFDPIDHTQVDARLGSWKDVRALAGDVEVMADVIVNHISCRSPQFLDYSARGRASRLRRHVPDAGQRVSARRLGAGPAGHLPAAPGPAVHADDAGRWLAAHPVDHLHGRADRHRRAASRRARAIWIRSCRSSRRTACASIRLDAVGYAIKRAGTQLLHDAGDLRLHPRVLGARRRAGARSAGGNPLPPCSSRCEIARQVDRVYDFALPPLVLHAFFAGTARYLKHWIAIRPAQCAHRARYPRRHRRDRRRRGRGRPVAPSGPAAGCGDRRGWCETIHRNSHGESLRATGAAASNLDLYQVNCTFFDALARDDAALSAGARHPVLPAGHSAGVLRRAAGRPQRHGTAGPHARGARHQPPPLHARRDRRGAAAAGGAGSVSS